MSRLVLLLALTLALPAQAQEARQPTTASAANADLGVVRFQIAPDARISQEGDTDDQVLSLLLSRQGDPLASQLRGIAAAGLESWSVVPLGRGFQRLDLRLTPAVRGTQVVRRAGSVVEVQLSSRLFAGAASQARPAAAPTEGQPDVALTAVLNQTVVRAPTTVALDPLLLPIGAAGPVRAEFPFEPPARTWGRVPTVIREAWDADELLRKAVRTAEEGNPSAGARSLHGYPASDDAHRALLALARGWIWSQPTPPGRRAASAGLAGEAFHLAAAFAPDAPWAPWAHARAAYHRELEHRFDEALLLYRRALDEAPDHPERPYWEVGAGISAIGRGDADVGLVRIARWLGGAAAFEQDFVFEARRVVLHALWSNGEPARAARLLDLLRSEHPALATHPRFAQEWGLLMLDAGRYPEAKLHLEELERRSSRVERERTRWWLHEAALGSLDILESRRALRRLMEQTPATTLGPLARLRLRTLDLWSAEPDKREMGWAEFSVVMQQEAQHWPHTSVEREALSLAAQVWFSSGLVEDALRLYAWVEERGGPENGAVAYSELACTYAPATFESLLDRGHTLAALGIWREHLEDGSMRACGAPNLRLRAAQGALDAGLPDLAVSWLGYAVAQGQPAEQDGIYLMLMARAYLAARNVAAAERTLRFIANEDLPHDALTMAEITGALRVAQSDWEGAASAFDDAVRVATASRALDRIPQLQIARGRALAAADNGRRAETDLVAGLAKDGSDDVAGDWVLVARIRHERADDGTSWTEPGLPAQDAWEGTLAAADAALAEEPTGPTERAARWHRAAALVALGQQDDGAAALSELAKTEDAWGLLARERLTALTLAAELDASTASL